VVIEIHPEGFSSCRAPECIHRSGCSFPTTIGEMTYLKHNRGEMLCQSVAGWRWRKKSTHAWILRS